jgi:hypothetical protein
MPHSADAPGSLKTGRKKPKTVKLLNEHDSLEALSPRWFAHGAGATRTIIDGILRLPFDPLENETFRAFAKSKGIDLVVTSSIVTLDLQKLGREHKRYRGEAMRRRDLQKDALMAHYVVKSYQDFHWAWAPGVNPATPASQLGTPITSLSATGTSLPAHTTQEFDESFSEYCLSSL